MTIESELPMNRKGKIMVIFFVILLMCVGVCFWHIFFDDVIVESIIGKIVAAFTLFPLSIAISAFVATLCAMFFSLPTLLMETEIISSEPIPIYSLEDNSGINGSFFLGSGSINSELCYYYIVDTPNGKSIQSAKVGNSYIAENEETPNVIMQSEKLKSKFWEIVLLDLHGLKNQKVILTVPQNTIITKYNIDLQ